MTTKHRRIVGVSLVMAVVLSAAATAGATTTYYRVTDLGPVGGVAGTGETSPLNAYIPPASGWVLEDVTEAFPTGHLIGLGTQAGPQLMSFGLMSLVQGSVEEFPEIHFLGLTPLLPGDANADGLVNGADLGVWQQHYDPIGVSGATFFTGDWSGDGRVNGGDLALWQQNYNPVTVADFPYLPDTQIGAHAPEPVTILGIFLGLGSVGAYIRRRRMA